MDSYEWKDADGDAYGVDAEGLYWQKSYNERYQLVEGVEAGDDAILRINSGASDEILRLAERERKLREAATEFLCKAITVQRANTPEWMEYLRDAANALAKAFDLKGRVEINADRLSLRSARALLKEE